MSRRRMRKVNSMICLMKDRDGMTAKAKKREVGLAVDSAKKKLIDRDGLNQVHYTRGTVILFTKTGPSKQLNRIPGDL